MSVLELQFGYLFAALALSAALISWYAVSAFHAWYRLRHIPGPFLASFSYLWMIRNTVTLTQGERMDALHEKYGPLVRISPNYLVTNDPSLLRYTLGARSPYKRTSWYDCFKADGHDTMASMLNTKSHDKLKAKLTSGYHGRDNTALEEGIDSEVQHLLDHIRNRHLESPAEFTGLTRRFTLDSLTQLAFGKSFGFLEAKGDLYDYFRSIDQFAIIVTLIADVPFISRLLNSPLLAPFRPKDTDKLGLGKVLGLAHQNVAQRYDADEKQGNDIMGSFMRHGLTQKESEAETFVFLLAGADNNAILLQTAMLYILSSPQVYRRLKDEVRQAVRSGEVSSPITFEQAKKLPYMQVKYCNDIGINYLALNRKHGWSTTIGAFKGMQIDLTSLSSINIEPDNQSAIIQGGAYLGEVIDTLWEAGYIGVTGSSACPGFVGPALGGGHGRYEGLYGLASDNLISLNMVLADGSEVQVSDSSYPDLFWGMKGAGQNFGIVTSAKAKIYPRDLDTWHYHNFVWTGDKLESVLEALNVYHGNGSTPARMGVNHGIYLIDSTISETEAVLSWSFAYAGSAEEAEEILKPFSAIETASQSSGDASYPELVEIQGTGLDSATCYHGDHPVSSALLRTYNITAQRQIYDLYNQNIAMYPELSNTAILLESYATKGMSDIPADTSAYPWREELHINFFFASLEPGSDLLEHTQQWAQQTRDLWHQGEPTLPPRTYMNYAAGYETAEEMYGYEPWRLEKLRGLKQRYDPNNHFGYFNSFIQK